MDEKFDKFMSEFNEDCHLSRDECELTREVWQAAQPQWQPIETAPMNGVDILILSSSGFIHQASWWIEEDRSDTITHWMSLPPPPQQ